MANEPPAARLFYRVVNAYAADVDRVGLAVTVLGQEDIIGDWPALSRRHSRRWARHWFVLDFQDGGALASFSYDELERAHV